jgi:hypothetical protein
MKLLKIKFSFTDDIQLFHLVKNKEWKRQEKWNENMLNLHIETFCDIRSTLKKDDEYLTFEKKKYSKKICIACLRKYKLSKSQSTSQSA